MLYLYGIKTKNINVYDFVQKQEKNAKFQISNKTFGMDPARNKLKYLQIIDTRQNLKNMIIEGSTVLKSEIDCPMKGDFSFDIKTKLVTFIVPSIGRKSLNTALQSIVNTESNAWKALIIFDGFKPENLPVDTIKHDDIKSVCIPKVGFKNCAGKVRNHGIQLCDTEWVAFLDDDDQITQDYLYRFQQEIKLHPNADTIVFRMLNSKTQDIFPPLNGISRVGSVGISFAVKTKLFKQKGIEFHPSPWEDFSLLQDIFQSGFIVHLSNYITYLVR